MGKWDGPLTKSNKGLFTKKPDTVNNASNVGGLTNRRTPATRMTGGKVELVVLKLGNIGFSAK